MTLKWLPEAQDDLQRLYDFIEPHNQEAAVRAINLLVKAAETLKEFPEKGKPWKPDVDFRELLVPFGVRGYVIRYRLHEDQIVIVRIWHALEDR